MPPNWYASFIYFWIRLFSSFSKYMERKVWGYFWCKTCNGEKIYPNSGLWIQPDGWQLCPDCSGHRWYHLSLTWKSQYPGDCYCYLNNGETKDRKIMIKYNHKSGIHQVICLKCKRRAIAKKEWLAILKWNNLNYPWAVKFLKENVYNE